MNEDPNIQHQQDSIVSDPQNFVNPQRPVLEPVQPQSQSTPQPAKQIKKSKVTVIVIIILVVALLGLVGFIFWQNFIQPKDKNITADIDTSSTQTEPTTASTVASGAYELINSKYASATTKIKLDFSVTYSPAYKPSGADYYVSAGRGIALTFLKDVTNGDYASSAGFNAPVVADVDGYLIAYGFNKDTIGADEYADDHYQSSTVVCSLTKASTSPITLECADKTDYAKIVTAVSPFAQAYVAGNPSVQADSLIYGAPTLTSGTTGYQNAQLSIGSYNSLVGGSVGLFYRENSGNWKYFMSTQGMINCDMYNTSELRAAFNGEKCYDSSAKVESTVE